MSGRAGYLSPRNQKKTWLLPEMVRTDASKRGKETKNHVKEVRVKLKTGSKERCERSRHNVTGAYAAIGERPKKDS